jgi:NodT family efflux transporter outer membrane factor (OMF) lipoprotein
MGLAAALAAGGCAVGPDFHSPEAPTVSNYTETALPAEIAGEAANGGTAQRFVAGQDIPAQWWTLFHSPALDQLIRQALAHSPTLAAAQATLRQAEENMRAQSGALLYPSVDAKLGASRQRTSAAGLGVPNAIPNTFDLYNASVSVSYTINLSGGFLRALEGLQAQVDYQKYQIEAAYLALTANIVTTAVKEASLRAQLAATREILAIQEQQLEVVEKQLSIGGVSRADVLLQRSQVAQTRASLPPLEKNLAQTRNLLAVYAGKLPGEGGLPEFELASLNLPQDLPLSLPSEFARQRPDIRASEELLHQASALVGVATANLYPSLTLSAGYGQQANKMADLFSTPGTIWNIGGSLLQPLFHGGQLNAQRRAAIAAYDAAAAQYRGTVLQAFQNVADTLLALETDARAHRAQADAESLAHDTLELTQKQFELGATGYLALLAAQRQYQQARIGAIQAGAARYADTAALFQALGGGWWNRPALAQSAAAGAD